MTQIIPTMSGQVIAPPRTVPHADLTYSEVDTPVTGVAAPPLSETAAGPYRVPFTTPMVGGGVGGTTVYDVRAVDPGYGLWSRRAHFLGQGFYQHTPDTLNQPVTGQGTPNVHPVYLRQGVLTQLASYVPNRAAIAAQYVGALTPQTIPTTGLGG